MSQAKTVFDVSTIWRDLSWVRLREVKTKQEMAYVLLSLFILWLIMCFIFYVLKFTWFYWEKNEQKNCLEERVLK